ncbi:high light inducible protein [Prochlorococcus sp. MIT 1341]
MKNSPQLDAVANPFLAERINGWAAMMGLWALVGAYISTGQIVPGIV